MSRTQRAISGTITSFMQYGLQIFLQILLVPLILYFAGQQTLGAYAVISQAIGYLVLMDFGFSVSINRYAAQAFHDYGKRFRDILTIGRTFLLASNMLYCLAMVILAGYIGPMLDLDAEEAQSARLGMYILALWSVIRTPFLVYSTGLVAVQDLAMRNVISMIGNSIKLGSSLALVAAGFGIVGLMVSGVIAEALELMFCTVRFNRLHPIGQIGWGIPDRAMFAEMFIFGAQALLINVAVRLVLFTDNIIVGAYLGAVMASVYYTTQMPAMLGWMLINRIVDSSTPALNELYAHNARDRLRAAFLRLHRYNLLLVLPFAVGLIFLNKSAIKVWAGEKQYGGDLMTYSMALFAIFLTIGHVSHAIVMATGKIKTLSIMAVTEGFVNLGLSILFIHKIGLGGVMLATLLANMPTSIYLHVRALHELDVHIKEFIKVSLLPTILPLLSGTVGIMIWLKIFPSDTWLYLISASGIFVAICGLVSVLTLPSCDRDMVRSYLRQLSLFSGGCRNEA